MCAANGCFTVWPGSHQQPAEAGVTAGQGQPLPQQQQQQHARQGQEGHQGGLLLEVPAGTAVITSDTLLHGSGPNRSRHMRRAWMPQFSAAPLTWRGDGSCVSLAIPLQPAGAPCN